MNNELKDNSQKKVAIVLVNYKDYAEKYLADCLASLKKQDYEGEIKIFMVDNASTEASYNYLKSVLTDENINLKALPAQAGRLVGGVEIVRNEKNDGFAKGNNDAIKLALAQGFDYVILFNLDTIIESDCVRKMVEIAERPHPSPLPALPAGRLSKERENIGAVQARLMLWPKKEKINSLGNVTHFLGFGYAKGYGEKLKSPLPLPAQAGPLLKGAEITYPSGAAVLFKREALLQVGLFDEEFWMYNEDQDLGWRLWLNGWRCVLANEAVVYHKYEFSRSIKKYYFMDRNRIMAMLKNYRWLTLILVLPAFIIMEVGLIFFSLKNGWFKEKMNVYKYFFYLKNWRYILKARKQAQALRKVKDREIIKLFSGRIWYQEIGERKLKIANVVFGIYWEMIKVLIIW